MEEGAKGVLKGFGRGIAGVIIKPSVGAIDLITRTTEGVRNTTLLGDKKVERKRPPRYFGTGDRLKVNRHSLFFINKSSFCLFLTLTNKFIYSLNFFCIIFRSTLNMKLKGRIFFIHWEVLESIGITFIGIMRSLTEKESS